MYTLLGLIAAVFVLGLIFQLIHVLISAFKKIFKTKKPEKVIITLFFAFVVLLIGFGVISTVNKSHKNNNKTVTTTQISSKIKVTDKQYEDGTYTGEIVGEKREGNGVFTFKSGEKYDGQWKNGLMNGTGTIIYTNGNTYTGEFSSGKKSGTGKFTWANGDAYQGKWSNDMMNGSGVYTYSSGAKYDGNFKDNKMNGSGTFTDKNGVVKSGTWQDNNFVSSN